MSDEFTWGYVVKNLHPELSTYHGFAEFAKRIAASYTFQVPPKNAFVQHFLRLDVMSCKTLQGTWMNATGYFECEKCPEGVYCPRYVPWVFASIPSH